MTVSSPLSQWYASGQVHTLQEQQLFIQTSTTQHVDQTTILCLHGFPTSSYDWHLIWPELSKKYNVIAPDFLGFGFSDKPQKHQYTIAEQADLIERLLKQYNISQIHIIAHDYGTIVAQELLARSLNPSPQFIKIQSVTFLNGALFPEMHRPRFIQKLLLSPIGGLVSHLLNEKRFNRVFPEVFGAKTQPTQKELHEYWELISYNQGNKINHLLMHYFKERTMYRKRWVTSMQNTNIPLALINGLADPVSGQHLVNRIRKDLPQAQIFAFPEIGHYPHIEAPNQTLNALFTFIASTE